MTFQSIGDKIAALEAQVAALTAERDQLAAQVAVLRRALESIHIRCHMVCHLL